MEESADELKSKQLSNVMSGLQTGVTALGKAMEAGTNQIGIGKADILTQPVTDSFGTFNTKKEFFLGCDVGQVLEDKGGVVIFASEDPTQAKVTEIGKVPAAYDPNKGGVLIADAGGLQEFLVAIKSKNKQTQQETMAFRYVNRAEIMGAVIKKGESASLNPTTDSSKQIVVQGNVTSVASLH